MKGQNSDNLPLNELRKCELKKCNHGIENPISKPLLIINGRFHFNCHNRCISAQKIKTPRPQTENYSQAVR